MPSMGRPVFDVLGLFSATWLRQAIQINARELGTAGEGARNPSNFVSDSLPLPCLGRRLAAVVRGQ